MQYYEGEVFSLGIWRNFEEMEESLTLSELLRMYAVVRKREMRQLKMHLKAQGAEVVVFDDGPVDADRDPDAFSRIGENIKKKKQEAFQSQQEEQQGGSNPFGVAGIGFRSS